MTRIRPLSALTITALAAFMGLMLGGCPGKPAADTTDTTAPSGTTPTAAGGSGKKLVIAWAEWEPAKQLDQLSEEFTKETGIDIEVQAIPWPDFENKIKLAWSGQESAYDMIIGDSQWLGKAATQGHYVDLTEWAKTNVPLADIAPAALRNYGEYPAGSGKIYALPCMLDAATFAYRKDLFEDPKEKAAFKAKYGRDLAPPKTWEEFRQVAEFFTRPDQKLYGAALFYAKEYDGATMGFDQVLWAHGGDLSKDGKAEGVINSPEAVKALQFYAVDLKKFTPPGSESFYFNECLQSFQQGQVAMAQEWFAFLPDLTSKEKNPKYYDKTGFFPVPKGPAGQFASLGGQGISISAYSKNQEDAKKYIAWFQKEETQKKWAARGGLTGNTKVAASEEFKKATPYNVTFAQTVPHLKDYYNNPQYSELLTISQQHLNEAIAGSTPPKAALDAIAKKQQPILDQVK